MRVLAIEGSAFHELSYRNAAPGRRGVEESTLPVYRAMVDKLPDGVETILLTSDLQGYEWPRADGHPARLLGEVLAEELDVLGELGVVPPTARTGVVLAGDLYARPELDRRGGFGDVRLVWRAFAARFRWVAGVAGNHDGFGTPAELAAFRLEPRVYLLDEQIAELDGLRLGGVSGIVGNSNKPWRRPEPAFIRAIQATLSQRPSVLVLHQNPDDPSARAPLYPSIGEALSTVPGVLTVCGHHQWPNILARWPGGGQVLNVDHRAVLVSRSGLP